MTHLLQARIPDELWDRVQSEATKDRRSVAQWVRLLIEHRLGGPYWTVDEVPNTFAKGIPAAKGSGSQDDQDYRPRQGEPHRGPGSVSTQSPSPIRCKHKNQIRKVGRPFCSDCGEFV